MTRKGRSSKRSGDRSHPPSASSTGETTPNRMNTIPAVSSSFVLLPIVSTFDSTKVKTKTWKTENLDVEGLSSSEAIPMYGGSMCREEFLYFLHCFQEFIDNYDITTGKKLFAAFRSQLYGPAKQRWEALTEGNSRSTVEDFKKLRSQWISELFDPTDYAAQVQYLTQVKKPREMSIETFVSRLQTIVLLMKYMPREDDEETDPLTERAIKRIIYFACPQSWRQKFEYLDRASRHLCP
jgi:hypothetical protein